MKKVDIVHDINGEWIGIYLNGKLWEEGHSIPVHRWLELLEEEFHCETNHHGDWPGEEYGSLPLELDEAIEQIEGE